MPLQNRQYSSVSIPRGRKNRMHTDSQRIIASFRTALLSHCPTSDRDAAEPGRHDRIPTGSDGLPEDGGERQARRPANDPNTIVCTPDGLRDQLRSLTRMQFAQRWPRGVPI